MRVYLASGWFNPTQVTQYDSIKDIIIKNKLEMFSPRDDNLCAKDADTDTKKACFEKNVREIKSCDLMIANTQDKDMGVMIEIGIAYENGVPIIMFCENIEKPNLMLAMAANVICKNYEQLSKAIDVFKNVFPRYKEDYTGEIE